MDDTTENYTTRRDVTWRQHNPVGDCAYCDRRVTIGV